MILYQKDNHKRIFSILLFILINNSLHAQIEKRLVGTLFERGDIKIELFFKISSNPCGSNLRKNTFLLKMRNVEQHVNSIPQYLNWKMNVINCNGDMIAKTFSVNLHLYNSEGFNESMDWEFDAESIEKPFYDVSNTAYPDFTKDLLLTNARSTPPSSISGNLEIMSGQTTSLSVVGGVLAKDANWVWYKDACSGNPVGKGSVIAVTPHKTTTYFVRAEGKLYNTNCVSADIVVDNDSRPGKNIIGNDKICLGSGNKVDLKILGGKLGYNANWVWYEGGCGGLKLGIGNKIEVYPKVTTTYFVRAEGITNITDCIQFTVEVLNYSKDPLRIKPVGEVCQGKIVKLELEGGQLAKDAKWLWYSQKIDPAYEIGEGSSIEIMPDATEQIFVRAEGYCNASKEVDLTVKVIKKPTDPIFISKSQLSGRKKMYSLKVIGVSLDANSNWVWYKGSCGGNKIGKGREITYRAKNNNQIFVRAESSCNNSNCASLDFSVKKDRKSNKKFSFINLGTIVSSELTDFSSFSVSLGSQSLYLKAKFGINLSKFGESIKPTYECNNNSIINFTSSSGTYYVFNGDVFNKRTSYTIGYMFGGKVLRCYLGGGWGIIEPIWGIDLNYISGSLMSKKWAKNIEQSLSGSELEAGLFLKMGNCNLMGGASIIYSVPDGKYYIDSNIGIGFSF